MYPIKRLASHGLNVNSPLVPTDISPIAQIPHTLLPSLRKPMHINNFNNFGQLGHPGIPFVSPDL